MRFGSSSDTDMHDTEMPYNRVDSNVVQFRVGLFVPTLNAGLAFKEWIKALESQSLKPEFKLLIDSSSTDQTVSLAKAHGFDVRIISREEFDHGRVRQLAATLLDEADIIVYLTQDAILASTTALERIVDCFVDDSVASAYGRQLPAYNASALSAHHRSYNYPETSFETSKVDLNDLGIRAVYCSNSFAAYRRSALLASGGFSEKLIMGEDMLAALALIEAGHKHRYCADATVYHSHNFSLLGEFRRFFDMGVFHRVESRIGELRGSTKQEGRGYVAAEIRFAWHKGLALFCKSLIRNGIRAFAYSMGRRYRLLPNGLCKQLTASPAYWCDNTHSDTNSGLKDN